MNDSGLELNESRIYSSIDEVLRILAAAKGMTFRELDKTGRANSPANKGALGNIIEESVLGYPVNSDAEADIQIGDERYELKVMPAKHIRKGKQISAKERLVIDIINFMKLAAEKDFDASQFWSKAKNIILVCYFDDRADKQKELRVDCSVIEAALLRYTQEDLATIRADWKTIRDKVANGHADQLSESDTNYLAACTKGADSSTLRDAPAPNDADVPTIRAKQRAFSYKASYMTTLLRKLLRKDSSETLPMRQNQALEDYIHQKVSEYFGKSTEYLAQHLDVTPSAKQFNFQLALRMLGAAGSSVGKIDQFAKANVSSIKTVVMYNTVNMPQEHMSFRQISADEWAELGDPSIEWHDSFLYNYFEENRFLFMVFKALGIRRAQSDKLTDVFTDAFLWNMPEEDIEQYVRPVWEELHRLMVDKQSLHYARGTNRIPGPSFNKVFHIRPKGQTNKDTVPLPNGELIPKQAFWLDKHYIADIITRRYTQR